MFEMMEHTADVGLRIRAPDLNTLFAEAGRAMLSLLVENPAAVHATTWVLIELSAARPEDLLLDWLSELAGRFDRDRLLLCQFELAVESGVLRARAGGESFNRRRHRPRYEIKAVTYHRLKLLQTPAGWMAEVILDI